MNREKSFTLIELLIVIGILAVIATVVIIVLNPTELLKQARDSTRLSDLGTLNTALNIAATQRISFFGTSSIVYVSISDSTSTCANLGLPTLPSGWFYNCVPSSTLTKVDGTGWVPVNFTQMTIGVPFSNLPIDPINTTSSGQYHTYAVQNNSWELDAPLESNIYRSGGAKSKTDKDGGDNLAFYEIGTNLALTPAFTLTSGSVSQANTHLSIVNGTAFADLLGLNLTPYLNDKLTITDHAGKTLIGYIKAAGTGETLGAEVLVNPTWDVNVNNWDTSYASIASVAGGQSGNALETTVISDKYGPIVYQQPSLSSDGMLLRASVYCKNGSASNVNCRLYVQSYGYGEANIISNGNWQQLSSVYLTSQSSACLFQMISACYNVGYTILWDTASMKQVTSPSATGVTIVSTPGGSIFNWTNEQSGFNRNDSNGYTYRIDL